MEIFYAPRDVIQIDDATLIFKNFEGRETQYNRKGDRNFAIRIDNPDDAEKLRDRGWNVRIKPGRDEDDGPFMYLPVKLGYNKRDDGTVFGPNAYLWSGNNRITLDEESISTLDQIEIETVNLDIRPNDWNISGRSGRTAWLKNIEVYQRIDRFAARYAQMDREDEQYY